MSVVLPLPSAYPGDMPRPDRLPVHALHAAVLEASMLGVDLHALRLLTLHAVSDGSGPHAADPALLARSRAMLDEALASVRAR